jgi:hypothetical protein
MVVRRICALSHTHLRGMGNLRTPLTVNQANSDPDLCLRGNALTLRRVPLIS